MNINDSNIRPELTFRRLVYLHMQQLTNFPYIEKDFDALTDYELLCLVVKYLNDVIANSNEQNKSITNLYNAFLQLQTYMNNSVQELEDEWNNKTTELEDAWTDKTTELETAFNNLQTWIDNYFDNLDVQDEINNKLDEMLEDGVLEQIIEQFIQSTAIWCFDTVNDMKNATNLIDGSFAKTFGYYSINDGGGANYKIRTKTTDDVADNGSIIEVGSTLVAELNVNQSINIKQFGAKGNGVDLDDVAFANALNYIKNSDIKVLYFNDGNYLLSTQLTLSSGKYIGLGNATLTETNSTNEIFITNEHYLNYDYQDEIEIKDLTIVKTTVSGNGNGKRCFRFACTNNLHMDNIIMRSNVDSQFGAIDLYSYNTNALVENCKAYKTNSSATLKNGGFAVREFSTTHTSENITIRDCLIEKDGIDESLWIDGWRGTIKNILVDNFIMIDNADSNSQSSAWIGSNASGSNCENVTLSNSYLYKRELGYRILAIGDSEEVNSTCTASNIKILNCTFETELYTGSSNFGSLVNFGNFLIKDGCTVENCTFKNSDTDHNIPCFIFGGRQGPKFSINNKFYGKANRSIYGLYSSRNDLFELAPGVALFQNVSNIDNAKCLESIPYLLIVNASSDITDVNITNCTNVVCARFLQNNGNTNGIKYLIENCQIINTNNLTANYNQDTNHMSLILLNTDIKNSQITNANNITLKSNGLSIEGNTFKGVPSYANDRNNYPIGTTFFSNTATKSIVRKISDGDQTSNWEEI